MSICPGGATCSFIRMASTSLSSDGSAAPIASSPSLHEPPASPPASVTTAASLAPSVTSTAASAPSAPAGLAHDGAAARPEARTAADATVTKHVARRERARVGTTVGLAITGPSIAGRCHTSRRPPNTLNPTNSRSARNARPNGPPRASPVPRQCRHLTYLAGGIVGWIGGVGGNSLFRRTLANSPRPH